jgi:hypothetical protein
MASNHHFLLNPKQTLKAKKPPGKFAALTPLHPGPGVFISSRLGIPSRLPHPFIDCILATRVIRLVISEKAFPSSCIGSLRLHSAF